MNLTLSKLKTLVLQMILSRKWIAHHCLGENICKLLVKYLQLEKYKKALKAQ